MLHGRGKDSKNTYTESYQNKDVIFIIIRVLMF